MAIRSTFCKDERLKREQHIETLFRNGKAFSVFPLRIIALTVSRGAERYPARAGFTAPKKKFKHAVSRNRLKRLMREGWRLQKGLFYNQIPAGQQLRLFFIYTDNKEASYEVVSAAIAKGLHKLSKHMAQSAAITTLNPSIQSPT
jgi:ribonuclease P protein component